MLINQDVNNSVDLVQNYYQVNR